MLNNKLQKILNMILVTLLIIISLLFIFSLLGISGFLKLTQQYEMDVLAFTGAIIGGAITYIGVYKTIKHEQNIRKQDKNQNNIKLLTDVLNELRDDFNLIELVTYRINYVKTLNRKMLEKEPIENVKQILEQQGKERLGKELKNSIEIVEETTNKINIKLRKLLDEKIIYFDWEVFEKIELYILELEKIILKETFDDEETKKIFAEQKLEVCTKIINELRNYQKHLRKEMRKKV